MTIPSGTGTEVLKNVMHTRTDGTEVLLINGVADHIYTVLSVTVTNCATDAEIFYLIARDDGSGTPHYILFSQDLGSYETFVFSDRLVLSGTDELGLAMGGTCNVDITCSYIDQDWT